MVKVAMIGAGSLSFTRRLVMDILSVPELQDTEFSLMDIHEENLRMVAEVCEHIVLKHRLPARIVSTTDRSEAIRGADYVVVTIRVGGMEAFNHDIQIPLKYGVEQCVGDTLGPGGVFYHLRTIPVMLDICKDIRELAPNALLLNYTNPMAMNTWAIHRAGGVRVLGLCHGVQHTHRQIAEVLGVPHQELEYIAAGINHQTWFVHLSHRGRNMLPHLLHAYEAHPTIAVKEPCRIDVLRRFGFYSTESNGHLSEYLPWYRKNREEIKKWSYSGAMSGGETGGYFRFCMERRDEYVKSLPKWLSGEEGSLELGERTVEHASFIIEALETGRPYRGHFNVKNEGMIANLPNDSIVEIPCYVDKSGIHPVKVGRLPLACAATCRASISVQEMAVEAALTGNRELVKLAVLHDPLTAAVCTTEQVWQLCDEMFEKLAPWLPQFNGEGRTWADIPNPGL